MEYKIDIHEVPGVGLCWYVEGPDCECAATGGPTDESTARKCAQAVIDALSPQPTTLSKQGAKTVLALMDAPPATNEHLRAAMAAVKAQPTTPTAEEGMRDTLEWIAETECNPKTARAVAKVALDIAAGRTAAMTAERTQPTTPTALVVDHRGSPDYAATPQPTTPTDAELLEALRDAVRKRCIDLDSVCMATGAGPTGREVERIADSLRAAIADGGT